MASPKRKSVLASVISAHADGKTAEADKSFAGRVRARAGEIGLRQADLSRASGISTGSINEYWNGPKLPGADKLFDLARALRCSAEWLATGRGAMRASVGLIDADDADWIIVPRYDLGSFTPEAKPEPLDTVPIRRDWLNRSALASTRLWMTTMPPSLLDSGPTEGDAILCQDVVAPEGEGLYLWFLEGMPLVRQLKVDPFTPAGVGAPGRAWQVPADEGGPRLVARILGAIKLVGV